MADSNPVLVAFNRGVVSPLALGRVEIKRLAMSAEEQTNWIPRALGPMSLRPGMQYITNTYSNATAKWIPFIFSVSDTALIELTDSIMRVVVADAVVTRVAVGTVVANGNPFVAGLTGWTNTSDVGGTAAYSAPYAQLTGDGTNAGSISQTLTVAGGDIGKAHGLRIVIARGECRLRVGSASGLDDYVSETLLLAGTHSLQITPTGNIYIQLFNREAYPMNITSVSIEAAGAMTLPTPWTAAVLPSIRYDQSADVIFAAASGIAQKRIERRGVHSWSLVDFVCDDGPFLVQNTSPTTLTPSALTGAITLTSSKPVFQAGHVGALFRLTSLGQNVTLAISSQNTFCNPIKVTGLTAHRSFGITITGLTGSGNTVTLQQAIGTPSGWVDVASYTTNQSTSYNDALDNQIIYYRLGIKTGGYAAGTTTVTLAYAAGSTDGIARVTGFTNNTTVSANVITPMGATTATSIWYEGAWSAVQGYPSAVALHEARLWWAGKDHFWGSVTDAYTSNDDTTVGDSGPISRAIGSGPVDTINWLQSMLTLSVGAQTQELSARSDALGSPITPTNFNLKHSTSQGSAAVQAVRVDNTLVFVGRSGSRVFEQETDAYTGRASATDLTIMAPEMCQPQVSRLAVQRNIDTRLHLVRSDGKVAMLVFDAAEDVKAWVTVETNGVVEDVVVFPAQAGSAEDTVYYSVARTVNGSTVRFLEKWALQSDCVGGTLNKQADAFYIYSGAPTNTITVAHLPSTSVVVWGDGKYQGTFTTSAGGVVTLPAGVTVSNAVVGLGYQARFKSTKMSEQPQELTQKKRIDHIALVMKDTHYQGVQFGQDYTTMDYLPLTEGEAVTPADTVWATYDQTSIELDGIYDSDARLCLVANAPLPCTVVALKLDKTVHEKG